MSAYKDDDRFLSPEECARALSVSRKTIYRMIRRRRLLAARVEGQLRIRASHVDDYVGRPPPIADLLSDDELPTPDRS